MHKLGCDQDENLQLLEMLELLENHNKFLTDQLKIIFKHQGLKQKKTFLLFFFCVSFKSCFKTVQNNSDVSSYFLVNYLILLRH